MKNYLLLRWNIPVSDATNQLLLAMRFTAMLLLLGAMHLSGKTLSQTVTLNVRNTSLRHVFAAVEKQTGYTVLYSDDVVQENKTVSMNVTAVPLKDFLTKVLSPVSLTYRIDGTSIFIKPLRRDKLAGQLTGKIVASVLQQRTVTGKVTDGSQKPLEGVTVTVRGTSVVTTTDSEGGYRIQLPESSTVLIFSNVGFEPREELIGNRSNINVSLAASISNLEEVVVVGYGTVRRKDLTGSVSSVESKQIQDLPIARVDEVLAGRVPGVEVKLNSGQPGAAPQIRIRGVGSISAGVAPLYVVDGIPVDDITAISPGDIASIDVLKDASATAIYGSRGSNGVVIINTARGNAGKPQFMYEAYLEFQQVERVPNMLNAKEQAQYTYDGFRNRNLDNGYDVSGHASTWQFPAPPDVINVLEGRNNTDVNAWDWVFRTAPQNQHRLSATGGNQDVKYAINGTYLNQQGVITHSDFTRYSLRANLDAKLAKRLDIQLGLNPSFMENNGAPSYAGGYGSLVGSLIGIQPWIPLLDENGEYTYIGGNASMADVVNPLARAQEDIMHQSRFNFLGNINAKYNIVDGLDFNTMVGVGINNSRIDRFTPSLHVFFDTPPDGRSTTNQAIDWLGEFTLNYDKYFNDHHLIGLVGYTAQKSVRDGNYMRSLNYPNNLVRTLSAVGGQITEGTSTKAEFSLLSYLARINYIFKDKYYVTGTIRTDGSSRFGTDNKFGYFPSVALAWRLSEENFMGNIGFLNELKFRVSYGQSGNNNIGNYDHFANIEYVNYNFANQVVGGFAQGNVGNPVLSWEKQQQTNIGLDASLFSHRLRLTADYFRSRNYDLLLEVPIPSITGFNSALQNIGEVKNTGWEFILHTVNVSGKFEWTTNFNISSYRNEVVKLGPEGNPIYSGNNITTIGKPMGMFYGLMFDGIFMNQEELDAGPHFNPEASDRSRLGDRRFVDVSGPDGMPDGLINNYDYTVVGSPYPDFYYGMTNNFSYRNFNVSINLTGSQGGQIYNLSRDGNNSGRGRVRTLAFNKNYWKSEAEPGDGKTQRPNDAPSGGGRLPGSHWLDDASFLRINNITLGYNFSTQLLQNINIRSLRIYLTAHNPLIFTKYTTWNPDSSNSGNPLQPGRENNDYPLQKGLMMGVNVGF